MKGDWEAFEDWVQPFTEAQIRRLATKPVTSPDVVPVVAVRPKDAGIYWMVATLPTTVDGWASETGDGEGWEIQFGAMTTDEWAEIEDTFDGW